MSPLAQARNPGLAIADMAPRAPTVEWSRDRPVEQQILREYGVGIDCHSRFIQVCVLVNHGGSVTRVEREFSTDWGDICNAKAWALDQLKVLPKPPPPIFATPWSRLARIIGQS